MQHGLVSVMMPAYNVASYVAEAVRSVLAQTYPNWELLIVDDGSTDLTSGIVSQFRDPRVRLLRKENGGEASARNVALEHSRGEFIAFLDADDAYLPHHLEVCVGFLDAHRHRDAVYTDGWHVDEQGFRLATLQSRRRGPFEGRLYEELVRASDVFGPPMCVVLRHDLVARHRLRYDTRIVIGPDWDFFVRYADVGSFGYLDDRTGLYRVHRTNITARTSLTQRAGYLALCREKAIKTEHFDGCSADTRTAVFYDLLVNQLRGQPGRRNSVTSWPEFIRLPAADQGRLLRLMAADAILWDRDRRHVGDWLRRAWRLNPADRRAEVLARSYALSPRLCYALLRVKSPFRGSARDLAPFTDLTGRSQAGAGRRAADQALEG